MSKTKNKNRSEAEVLRGENRQLRKKLKQLTKQVRNIDSINDDIEEEPVEQEVPDKVYCPKCHAGEFKLILDLPTKYIMECDECDHRKSFNK